MMLALSLLFALQLLAVSCILFPNSKTNTKTVGKISPVVVDLLTACSRAQSPANRRLAVESIEKLSELQKREPISAGSWRTLWSTVTSDNLIGSALRQKPSVILGGLSWQVISKEKDKSENVVFWPSLGLRMAGLADLRPLAAAGKEGYKLRISGLEFRWGTKRADPIPEKMGLLRDDQSNGKAWTVLMLAPNVTLSNGVGALEVIYNDGVVRCVRDTIQDNIYVHIKEPVPEQLKPFLD
ncbi:hypothetical protein B484DRAFT_453436 [Ochromonadaceae sp. CCMP2298]|nr:hypothetical protein B484DRAFT_453436 [Ochromonadaceae sp. CCMP2298]